ncbi:hypothetical protein SLEP1_g35877 [Rubroshorea leprosula]|uniref:Uncharacterized protein n=1 Tax=Rubroshorea leprosula TaxID=152421 RepID=A0AAV5KPR2_9ROSI|nr:hypothetical protein SLEP1_g35877 [Rubroshorea leprosula]
MKWKIPLGASLPFNCPSVVADLSGVHMVLAYYIHCQRLVWPGEERGR